MMRCTRIAFSVLLLLSAAVAALASPPPREREPNTVYAERRAKLRTQLDGPVVLFGFTGRENASPSYVFNQEETFYYLTGFNYEGGAVLVIPEPPAEKPYDGPREILYLQPRNLQRERWDGPRLGPADADASERTGFATVRPFDQLKPELDRLAKVFTNFYTVMPRGDNEAGFPHARNWQNWLSQALPQASLKEVRPAISAMRQYKSPSEMKLIERAVELSMDAHFEAMRIMRPGVTEYEVAARMKYVHERGGCEGEAYAPIVGSGFYSTVLHYNDNGRKIQDGDVIVLDVGGQFSGYAADITRTLPASGKFTARQREIYEVVLGAQNAVLAALKPGVVMGRPRPGSEGTAAISLQQIAMDYMNSHGKDKDGKPLGQYFIHGLGHHVGLNVHDPSAGGPLEPGMVVTIEPGIYIPEENIGVRIEDMVLITAGGYKLLTARLPRAVAEIEKVMADAKKSRPSD